MYNSIFGLRTLVSVAFAAATGIAAHTAVAQATQKLEEITIEAARPSRSAIGAPITTVTTKRVVSYADISLMTPAGVTVLETRIRDAALSACTELEKKYPIAAEGDTTKKCIDNAVDGAMVDARKAIDAAKQRGPAYTVTPATQTLGEITIEAARPSRSAIGAPINTVTARRVVSYADISLTTPAGVTVLETRIRDAALSACTELEKKYPIAAEGDTTKKCIDNAVDGAMVDARKAIDAAKHASVKK